MKKYLLDNVYLHSNSNSTLLIKIDKYCIHTQPIIFMSSSNFKKHHQTAYIEFEGIQQDSILYLDGNYGTRDKLRKRKLVEDILLIGSILTGYNWGLKSRRNYKCYPLQPISRLKELRMENQSVIESHFRQLFEKLFDKNWQVQYENGFHLKMLFNHANIPNTEARFLSNMVIWEWLYPHEKNPKGATPKDESNNLKEIINFILNKYWPNNYQAQNNNIFHALRNQIAHSGKLPIDRQREYVDDWMREIPWDDSSGINLQTYLRFFDKLTQVIVLKTLGINAEYLLNNQLNKFLENGSLS
ncbi:MAG: hypothetical protein EP298_02300 [Gammaproteobacteria bacterium]|nr:MAG: hypothetical protein EP298_02300 [Gammaproteobacteria bacterium]UTW43481.1 hypothetical protein KFE69_05140 [bacterium SCSIO 12844]